MKHSGYKAILFSLDGEWVTDHKRKTIQEVNDAISDQGSKWIFYPIVAVIVDHGLVTSNQRFVDVSDELMWWKNRTIRALVRDIRKNPELYNMMLEWR